MKDASQPDQNWNPVPDFQSAITRLQADHGEDSFQGQFYRQTVNQLCAALHIWRTTMLLHIVPPDCHSEFVAFYNRNQRSAKEPKPMPFDHWGLEAASLHETCEEKPIAPIAINRSGKQSDPGLERRHGIFYGSRHVGSFEYTLMPLSQHADIKGVSAPPVWKAPEISTLPPLLYRKLGGLCGDPTAVTMVGEAAWVALAEHPRESLIEAVASEEGHRYPEKACKVRFVAANKAGTKLVEVAPDTTPSIPLWVLGQLPQE